MGRTISDKTLLLFSITVMLISERFPRADDDWEERAERGNTWAQRKAAYNKAHAQERVKSQASNGTVKFRAENSAARQDKPKTPS